MFKGGEISIKYESIITEDNIKKFKSGQSINSYEFMGSHVVSYKGKKGVSFMVWAPNAKCVYLSGEFNNWSIDSHPMTNLYHSGVWGIFIDNLSEGEKYK